MDAWRRKQMHSHLYRVPEPFRDQVVVVVGNSLSGQDISMELVNVAKEIHLSSKSLHVSEGLSKVISKHDNLHLHPTIECLDEDGGVVFVDGSFLTADTIIYCTGYSYSFPFLDTKGAVAVDDDRVGPLYEHTFPPNLAPSLSFIGIPRKISDRDVVVGNKFIAAERTYDITEETFRFDELYSDLNTSQRDVYTAIINVVIAKNGGIFFVSGCGGTGKTYLWRTLISSIRSQGKIVLFVASSGIASLLLPGGRTVHSRFHIPIAINVSMKNFLFLQRVQDLPFLLKRLFRELMNPQRSLPFVIKARVYLALISTAIYILSPVDIIPEALFGILGLLDDFIIALIFFLHVGTLYRAILLRRYGGSST